MSSPISAKFGTCDLHAIPITIYDLCEFRRSEICTLVKGVKHYALVLEFFSSHLETIGHRKSPRILNEFRGSRRSGSNSPH